MCVTPPYEVVVTYVHASCVADLAVDYHDFPVVTVVQLGHEVHQRPSRFCELLHLHAGIFHFVVVLRTDDDVGDILVYESDFHAFTCLLHQHFLDLLAALVLAEIEILHVYGFLGILQVLHQEFKFPVAGSDDFQAVAVSHASGAVARQKLGERLVVTFYEIVLLMSEKQSEDLVIGLCPEYLNEFLVLLLEIPRVAEIDADHKIEKQSDYRQNGDNQKPGDFFC